MIRLNWQKQNSLGSIMEDFIIWDQCAKNCMVQIVKCRCAKKV